MASQPRPEIPASFRFEFDRASKIMLIRFKGRVTNELLALPNSKKICDRDGRERQHHGLLAGHRI